MTTDERAQWRGWKHYCQHDKPTTTLQSLRHFVTCGKTPIADIDHEDCIEGCGCIWDASSPDYWKNHVKQEQTNERQGE